MKFYKSSRVTLLRPQILSIALASTWAFFVVVITLVAMASGQSGKLVQIFELTYPGYGLNLVGLILGVIWAYLYGYLTGYLIGYIYSKYLIRLANKHAELVFEADLDKRVNLIQKGEGEKPYTIVFVANPAIYIKSENEAVPDPISRDKILFYKVVMRCMRSFAYNELLQLPEIKQRLRLVTIFDETRMDPTNPAHMLCENLIDLVTVIAPRYDKNRPQLIKEYVQNTTIDHEDVPDLNDVDVIYMISASEELTRSAARFTVDDNSSGEEFDFEFQHPFTLETSLQTKMHAYFAEMPGTVALSAFDDRLKVPVHEFAHAMSAENNGIIYDEYVDKYHIDEDEGSAKDVDPADLSHFINRKHRASAEEPVPDVFANYTFNGKTVTYHTDRYRSDKPATWTSYIPEREDIYAACLMDYTYIHYLYDKLIFDFMYDRIMTKMERT